MTFSDAQPVQFWPANCETFNEKEVDGIFSKCFCQPFNCDDEITVQFKGTTGYTYTLLIAKEDGTTTTTNFSEISTGIYQKTITPSDLSICDEQIILYVSGNGGTIIESFPFTSNIQGWANYQTTNYSPWTWSADDGSGTTGVIITPNVTQSSGGGMPLFYKQLTNIANKAIEVTFRMKIVSGKSVNLRLFGWPSDVTLPTGVTGVITDNDYRIETKVVTGTGAYVDYVFQIPFTGDIDNLGLDLTSNDDFSGFMYIDSVTIETLYDILYKSDCLDIKSSHKETVLINYHNNRPFASLNSSVGTPDPEFNLRIPGVFFKERFPEEHEVIELSNSTSVQLNAQVKAQRLLAIGPMTFYMHRKTKLALKFQNVTIDNQEWVQEENYELAETKRTHPLQQASVWLTEKDYIMRNIL